MNEREACIHCRICGPKSLINIQYFKFGSVLLAFSAMTFTLGEGLYDLFIFHVSQIKQANVEYLNQIQPFNFYTAK